MRIVCYLVELENLLEWLKVLGAADQTRKVILKVWADPPQYIEIDSIV